MFHATYTPRTTPPLKVHLFNGAEGLSDQEVLLRRRFLAAAVEVVGERGSAGVMAIELPLGMSRAIESWRGVS